MASESNPSFASHNPFRRKTSNPTPTTITNDAEPSSITTHLPSSTDFARALSAVPKSTDAPPPAVTFARKKPVKKVRVQSPPPSSPESAGGEHHTYPKYPLPERDPDEASSEEEGDTAGEGVHAEPEDPFQNEAPPLPEEAMLGVAAGGVGQSPAQIQQPYTAGRGPPPNPFEKTLEDIERDGKQAEQMAGSGKAGMDVEAFKRLLLTGQGPVPAPAPAPTQAGDGGSITETSSISRQSISDAAHVAQETPRTSHEISEPEADDDKRALLSNPPAPQRTGSRKKAPPPPPATRHGKLIKLELKDKEKEASLALERKLSGSSLARRPASTSPTDVNKPLPPPPDRAEDDVRNSIFDKEAAGKIPEVDIDPDADVVPPPRPPTPPNASHSASTPVQTPPASTLRKPSAPPPRRHGSVKSESRPTAAPTEEDTTPPRSSLESQRSRSSSLRLSLAAPTPPPPRRGHHRQSPSVSSSASPMANNHSYPFPTSPGSGTDEQKLSPPPPPPQRNTSVRKSSGGVASRPAKSGGAAPPPPPRPRARGGSKGASSAPAVEEEAEGEGVDEAAGDEAVRAMLADLDALQREVEAARAAAGGG